MRSRELKEGYHTGRGGGNQITLMPKVLGENSTVLKGRNPFSVMWGKDHQLTPHSKRKRPLLHTVLQCGMTKKSPLSGWSKVRV